MKVRFSERKEIEMRIYKYSVTPMINIQEITLPKHSAPLSIIEQDDDLVMYCHVDPEEDAQAVFRYAVVGTGWELPYECNCRNFIGTVKQGYFVWHLFWLGRK
jgi:hypothetical protein